MTEQWYVEAARDGLREGFRVIAARLNQVLRKRAPSIRIDADLPRRGDSLLRAAELVRQSLPSLRTMRPLPPDDANVVLWTLGFVNDGQNARRDLTAVYWCQLDEGLEQVCQFLEHREDHWSESQWAEWIKRPVEALQEAQLGWLEELIRKKPGVQGNELFGLATSAGGLTAPMRRELRAILNTLLRRIRSSTETPAEFPATSHNQPPRVDWLHGIDELQPMLAPFREQGLNWELAVVGQSSENHQRQPIWTDSVVAHTLFPENLTTAMAVRYLRSDKPHPSREGLFSPQCRFFWSLELNFLDKAKAVAVDCLASWIEWLEANPESPRNTDEQADKSLGGGASGEHGISADQGSSSGPVRHPANGRNSTETEQPAGNPTCLETLESSPSCNSSPLGPPPEDRKVLDQATRNQAIENLPQSYRLAYLAAEHAERQAGRTLTLPKTWNWLKENGIEVDGVKVEYELPMLDTFADYVCKARSRLGESRNRPRGGRTGKSIVRSSEI